MNEEKEATAAAAAQRMKHLEVELHNSLTNVVALKLEVAKMQLLQRGKRAAPRATASSSSSAPDSSTNAAAGAPDFTSLDVVTSQSQVYVHPGSLMAKLTRSEGTQTTSSLDPNSTACVVCVNRELGQQTGEGQLWAGRELSRRVSTASKEPSPDLMVRIAY